MKKLMFGLAIAAVGTAFAVESSNIVGYQTTDSTGKQFVSMGPTFISTGSVADTFKLGDMVLNGGDAMSDNIQVLESTKAAVTDTYVYVSETQAIEWGDASYQGWYDVTMSETKDDETFGLGQAFLGNFGTKAVVSTSAGQVVDGALELDCIGKQFVMFANPLPRAITLGEIVMDGGDAMSDNIQVLESTKAAVTDTFVYVSEAQAIEWGDASYQGWYDVTMSEAKDSETVAAGAAFLSNFGTKNITITFPSAL